MFTTVTELAVDLSAPPPDLQAQAGLYVLILCRGDIDPDWQWDMARKIALAHPVLVAAWGPGTTTWDDAIDMVCIVGEALGGIPHPPEILTTWHDGEPLEETVAFLATSPKYDQAPADKLLILDMGNTSATASDVARLLARQD
ncbi:DUF7684 family protein [Marimonas arenosa]|uniref:DUF7684 domain-containing protein n=1 Tax=Marimonas arenosa TaxID=1795305 RepID=A0AAE3WEP4_9RHOB|nr:hypothetical protein [Marimonas arenosa]MDQ2091314.1 hypothetical protein [Marimonas arenosa]